MKTNLPQEAQCGCSGSDFNLLGTAMVSMNSYLNLMPMWFGAFYDQWGVRNGGSRAFFFFTSSTVCHFGCAHPPFTQMKAAPMA